MTKVNLLYSVFAAAIALSGCSKDSDLYSSSQSSGSGNDNGSTAASVTGLTDFDVAFNYTALGETEQIPSGDNDYIENAGLSNTITISWNGSGNAAVTGDDEGAVTVSGADVTVNASKGYRYVLQGTAADGSLSVTSSGDLALVLNGVSLTNTDGAAINVQSKVCAYVVCNDGTANILADGGRSESDTKVKGAFFTKGKAVFSGSGSLSVYAKYKNGIDTKKNLIVRPNTNIFVQLVDTISKGCCIKCENETAGEGLFIRGGVLNLDNPSAAGKGVSADGDLTISGGRVTAICSSAGVWDLDDLDVSGAAGIKCDSTFTMTAGDLWMKSTGNGGKGINGDNTLNFNGGTVHILTTGGTHSYKYNGYTYYTSPKGIKTDGDIYVSGGDIFVRATGTTDGSEGMEAKRTYNQSGGTVKIYAADDGLNTGYSSEGLREKTAMGYDMTGCTANAGQVNISGGTLYAYSTSNDGMDSNGYIKISGGTAIAFGAGAPETCFDCDENSRFSITGGTLFGMGGASPNTPGASCTQCFAVNSFTSSANTAYTVKASDGTEIITVTVPRSYNSGILAVSSPLIQKGTTYTIGTTSFTTSSSSWITNSTQTGGFGGNMR